MGHKNVPNIVSLSHCLEQLFYCISTVIYVKAKKRCMRQCFREGHALYWKKMWFFLFTSCRHVYWCVRDNSQLCLLRVHSYYTLGTEENVRNVRVCACCNHFPIIWNKFYRNTKLETILNIRTRYIFQRVFRENIGDFTDLHNEKKINLEVTFKRNRFGYWNSCKRLPNFVNVAALPLYHFFVVVYFNNSQTLLFAVAMNEWRNANP